jgi:nitroreductase
VIAMSVIRTAQPAPVLAAIQARRSVSPRRLGPPAPTDEDIARLAMAALAAPDHGMLRPWRLIVPVAERLADLFEQTLLARLPDAAEERRRHEREKALNAPAQLILVARIDDAHPGIPVHEQWIAVGAALQCLLLAAEALGFAAKILSGERAADPAIHRGLDLAANESVVGFIALGTVREAPGARAPADHAAVVSTWPKRAGSAG